MQVFEFFDDQHFEFDPKMPEQLLAKAMQSTRPIFLTDAFLLQVSQFSAEQLVREMVADLHHDASPDDSSELLRWSYLFMDFERDFPRLMAMSHVEARDFNGDAVDL